MSRSATARAQRVVAEIAVRDVLDRRPRRFDRGRRRQSGQGGRARRRVLLQAFSGGFSQYFRPSRAGYSDDRSCENGPSSVTAAADWARHGARWMNPPAIVRFTAIRSAPRWRLQSSSRTSP
jgi:hypothetical protein